MLPRAMVPESMQAFSSTFSSRWVCGWSGLGELDDDANDADDADDANDVPANDVDATSLLPGPMQPCWVHGWMSGWMRGRVSGCVSGWVSGLAADYAPNDADGGDGVGS